MSHYEEVNVRGYDEFCKAVTERGGKNIFAYFSGDKDDQGKSWCPDCVKGDLILFTMNVFLWCFIEIFGVATLCWRPFCKTMIVAVVTRRRRIQLELMHVCFHIKLFYSVLVPFQPSPW